MSKAKLILSGPYGTPPLLLSSGLDLTVWTGFQKMIHSTVYVNLISVVCCCFLLLSFGVLPIEATRRHYLSVSLTVAVLLMQVRDHRHLTVHMSIH